MKNVRKNKKYMKNGIKNLRDGTKNIRGYMERLPLLKVIFAFYFLFIFVCGYKFCK